MLDIRPGIEIEDEAAVFGELDYVAELLSGGRSALGGLSGRVGDSMPS